MSLSARLARALSIGAVLALVAGCSGGAGPATPATYPGPSGQSVFSRSFMPHFSQVDALAGRLSAPRNSLRFYDPNPLDPAAPTNGVYAANYGNLSGNQLGGYFNLYRLPGSDNSQPLCKGGLHDVTEINDVAVDSAGTLWVPGVLPTNLKQGVILTYTKNTCTEAKTELKETGGQPADIVFATTGTRYVMDIVSFPKMTNGQIEVYPKGKSSPTSTMQLPGELVGKGLLRGLALGIAIDTKNNLYVTYLNKNYGSDITVFTGGKGPGKILQSSSNGVIYEGLTFDSKGNLLVATDSLGATVNVFAPPYNGTPTSFEAQGSAIDLKLDTANANLYVGDASYNTLDVYKYPSGTYEYSIVVTTIIPNDAVVEGVAVDPSDNN